MITREELITSKEYHIEMMQIQLFNQIERYLKNHKMTRAKFAAKVGVTKGYISQVLNGDYDFRLSKMIELSLAIGLVPQVKFAPISQFLKEESSTGAILNDDLQPSTQMERFLKIRAAESIRSLEIGQRIHPGVWEQARFPITIWSR
jgi:transcriptional regulator with XRE-family HTH domain